MTAPSHRFPKISAVSPIFRHATRRQGATGRQAILAAASGGYNGRAVNVVLSQSRTHRHKRPCPSAGSLLGLANRCTASGERDMGRCLATNALGKQSNAISGIWRRGSPIERRPAKSSAVHFSFHLSLSHRYISRMHHLDRSAEVRYILAPGLYVDL